LTFNLGVGGSIDPNSVLAPFTIATVLPVTNPPFGAFTSAINGACGSGSSSDGCGSVLSFLINNFNGFVSNDVMIGGSLVSVFFASDIINTANGQTGAVGAGLTSTPTNVPIPPAIALFAAGLVGLGMIRRRKKSLNLA